MYQSTRPDCVIFLAGPTATGKSDLSLRLARRLPCEIISVDSTLVYRGMDIGTAKPSLAARESVRHHLIDILDPTESYSAALFRKSALGLVDQILLAGRLPVLVGGTMFYFHTFEYGFDDMPPISAEVKSRIASEERCEGLAGLYAQLQRVDPVTAARLHPNDSQRIHRALGVYLESGRAMSEFQSQSIRRRRSRFSFQVLKYGLCFNDRFRLHARIETRFDRMLEEGLVDEVSRLMLRGDLDRNLPSMRAAGYGQMWSYLAGECRYSEMRDRAIGATRQLARKQLTWLRGMQGIRWREVDRSEPQVLAAEIERAVVHKGGNP